MTEDRREKTEDRRDRDREVKTQRSGDGAVTA